jgi:hypothetical protein
MGANISIKTRNTARLTHSIIRIGLRPIKQKKAMMTIVPFNGER